MRPKVIINDTHSVQTTNSGYRKRKGKNRKKGVRTLSLPLFVCFIKTKINSVKSKLIMIME